MSRIMAVFNQAGGVAKTTFIQKLGYQIAQLGHRFLLIDIDP
ncbi:ParA family protein [Nostoc sp. FACHB-133]|nr:AAA family ATPase [Nostoc sp. FACHB-133]